MKDMIEGFLILTLIVGLTIYFCIEATLITGMSTALCMLLLIVLKTYSISSKLDK